MVDRIAEKLVRSYSKEFRALAVVGPRQSGKTTLVRKVFPKKEYISLENPDERQLAETDPRGFLGRFPKGAILDEAQRVPTLFSYLQQVLDETNQEGLFILTGSNNFLLQQSVSQTLAGRIGYIDLLPLSFAEIQEFGGRQRSSNELILQGCYPELFDKNRSPGIWYPSYIRTYVERDVKLLRNIENSLLFTRFLQLCAGRIGQQLNVAAIGNECGIDVKTVNAWLGILQSSYIIHLLPPYFNSFNKRLVKTPKLYFIDTGLACSLLGIHAEKELSVSHFRGALFENYIIMDVFKKKYNEGSASLLYYWRDSKGVEVDLLVDKGGKLLPVEIKSGQTFQEDQLHSMHQWNDLSGNKGGLLLYDGVQEFTKTNGIRVQNWRREPGIPL
jgi:predicted AAA+ superfamily ATPase